MKLTNSKLIKNSSSSNQEEVFAQIADILVEDGSIKDKQKLIDGFKNREQQGSTALAEGFAIPHTVNAEIDSPKVVVLKKAKIESWQTLDGSTVDTVIAIIVPENGRGDHLTILSKLSGKLANPEFSKEVKTATAAKTVGLINSVAEENKGTKKVSKNGTYDIVAITACPTGIAHTYMAAEYLENTAKEMGYSIKVETQGQTIQNVLTQDEIDNAKAIIIAVDREVDLARLQGKEIIKTGTKKVIADSKGWIEKAINKNGTEVVK